MSGLRSADPRLKALELHQMLDVEGGTPEWCDQLLNHECGHAYDHAYRFSARRRWRQVFGSPEEDYNPETYRPRPYSHSYVVHLDDSTLLVAADAPQSIALLENLGYRTVAVDISEFVKLEGCVTCLSVRLRH